MRHPFSTLLRALVYLAAILTASIIVLIVGYILIRGIPNLNLAMFEKEYTSTNVSMFPAIINTLSMIFLSLIVAVPVGVFAAIYLVEYSRRGNRFVAIVRYTIETLAGIPSIVFGLFGYLIFVIAFKFSYSMLSGALTLAIMILPTIMRTTEEALMSVPDSFREGSFALGATRLRTVFRIVLPSAVPGILSGVILGIGRIVGETAALIYTAGTVAGIPDNLLRSGRTLSVHMYALLSEGLHTSEAYATAVVLLLIVFIINALSSYLAGKVSLKENINV